jgi:very-short-patch-repair endonuclease
MPTLTPADVLKKAQGRAAREGLEDRMALALRAERIDFVRQFEFWPTRRWRFDFALMAHRIAIEVQGGTWINGAHSRGSGIERDCEKSAYAVAAGWRVIYVTGNQVKSGQALEWVRLAVGAA